MSKATAPIDQEWIKKYVDTLINACKEMPDGAFKNAIMLRADNVMDLVEAWRKRDQ